MYRHTAANCNVAKILVDNPQLSVVEKHIVQYHITGVAYRDVVGDCSANRNTRRS